MHSSERAVQPWPPAACIRAARVYLALSRRVDLFQAA